MNEIIGPIYYVLACDTDPASQGKPVAVYSTVNSLFRLFLSRL